MKKFQVIQFFILYLTYDLTYSQEVNVYPRGLIINKSAGFKFICNTTLPIENCIIKTPFSKTLNMDPAKPFGHSSYKYFGDGFNAGHCGIQSIFSDDAYNGFFTCSMKILGSPNVVHGNFHLSSAIIQGLPFVRLIGEKRAMPVKQLNEGEVLAANCILSKNRPPANILWHIGDELIEGSSHALIEEEKVLQSDDSCEKIYSTSQNVSHIVSWRDHGKKLRCVPQYLFPSLSPVMGLTDILLQVKFSPKPQNTSTIEKQGFRGDKFIINMEIDANGQPTFTWIIDNIKLNEREMNEMYEAMPGKLIRSGKYHAQLQVQNIFTSINKIITLAATNEMGSQNYSIILKLTKCTRKIEQLTTVLNDDDDVILDNDVGSGTDTSVYRWLFLASMVIKMLLIIILITICCIGKNQDPVIEITPAENVPTKNLPSTTQDEPVYDELGEIVKYDDVGRRVYYENFKQDVL